jgi:hypothetical protein
MVKDEALDKFYLWQNKNQDRVSQNDELMALVNAGILSLDFRNIIEIHGELRELGALNKADVLWIDSKITGVYDCGFYSCMI